MVAAVEFPKRPELLVAVRALLDSYDGKFTVRQLYYRLVAAGIIPNNTRSYKNVVAALGKWRRDGSISVAAFEDRTRGMNRLDVGWREDDPEGWLRAALREGLDTARKYTLARWQGQKFRVVVAVEKQALEGPFTEVCEELEVDLAVCRGYPSISFLYEIARALKDSVDRRNIILYFGDFDPSGLNIPEVIERDLGIMFGQEFALECIALTREQADEMGLIPAPVKRGDARSAAFADEHGEEVYELDAIEPEALKALIRENVERYFDDDAWSDRDGMVQSGREHIERLIENSGIVTLLETLEDDEDEDGE